MAEGTAKYERLNSSVEELSLEERLLLNNLWLLKLEDSSALTGFWARRASRRARREDLLKSGLFEGSWYQENNPDIKKTGIDPFRHFLEHGSYEGRSPGPSFDTLGYLMRYKDVANARVEPWRHFYLHGKAENRNSSSYELVMEDRRIILEAKLQELEQEFIHFREKFDENIVNAAIMRRMLEHDGRLAELLAQKLPLERLVALEQVRAQWQASVPRILDRLKGFDKLDDLEMRINILENNN